MDLSEHFSFDDYYQAENIEASDDKIVSNAMKLVHDVETELDSSHAREERPLEPAKVIEGLSNVVQNFEENATDLGVDTHFMLEFAVMSKKLKRKYLELASSLKPTTIGIFYYSIAMKVYLVSRLILKYGWNK